MILRKLRSVRVVRNSDSCEKKRKEKIEIQNERKGNRQNNSNDTFDNAIQDI